MNWRTCFVGLCGAVAVVGWTPVTPAAAQGRQIQISITDSGMVPSNVMSLIDQPIQFRVTNMGKKVHQFSIPYYYIYTQNLQPGSSTSVGFTPNRAGRFEMMSDPTGNNTPEFKGYLTVTDQK